MLKVIHMVSAPKFFQIGCITPLCKKVGKIWEKIIDKLATAVIIKKFLRKLCLLIY